MFLGAVLQFYIPTLRAWEMKYTTPVNNAYSDECLDKNWFMDFFLIIWGGEKEDWFLFFFFPWPAKYYQLSVMIYILLTPDEIIWRIFLDWCINNYDYFTIIAQVEMNSRIVAICVGKTGKMASHIIPYLQALISLEVLIWHWKFTELSST